MDYATLKTTVARGQFDATADALAIADGILEAYRRIWFLHRRWDFRLVGPSALTVAAGTETPTLDVDAAAAVVVAEPVAVYDDLGCKLTRLSPGSFDEQFRYELVNNQRARPWGWKWQNGVLTLGPRPDAAYAFTYSYERQMGFLNAGTTFKVGDLAGATDTPAWNSNHHRALVSMARMIVAEEQGSAYAATAKDQSDLAVKAMEDALLVDAIFPSKWPSY